MLSLSEVGHIMVLEWTTNHSIVWIWFALSTIIVSTSYTTAVMRLVIIYTSRVRPSSIVKASMLLSKFGKVN